MCGIWTANNSNSMYQNIFIAVELQVPFESPEYLKSKIKFAVRNSLWLTHKSALLIVTLFLITL